MIFSLFSAQKIISTFQHYNPSKFYSRRTDDLCKIL